MGGAITDGDSALISLLPRPLISKVYSRRRKSGSKTLTTGVDDGNTASVNLQPPPSAVIVTATPVVDDGKTVKIKYKSLSKIQNQDLRNRLGRELESIRTLSRKVYSNYPDATVDEVAATEVARNEIAPEEVAPTEIAPKEIAPIEIPANEVALNEVAPNEVAAKEITVEEAAVQAVPVEAGAVMDIPDREGENTRFLENRQLIVSIPRQNESRDMVIANNGTFEGFSEEPTRQRFHPNMMSVVPDANNGNLDGYIERPRQRYSDLNVSIAPESNRGMVVEKRTPKANQYYQNNDFIMFGKDKFPPVESNSSSARKSIMDKRYQHAFKSCSALLTKLIKHKFGWVFDKPVDVKGLGLHDYYSIIRYPMDLGTIKSRLSMNWYKSPIDFAEDVRLTFHNAMIYNPKGQDVHIMAEQLLQIFEERWAKIEAELTYVPYTPTPVTRKPVNYSNPNQVIRAPVVKVVKQPKPKAKDLYKRDMTPEEKSKLGSQLMDLPQEKVDAVIEILRRKNPVLSQNGEEMEVDIESLDTETHWELDRFVSNYKKSLSKIKRRAEIAMKRKADAERQREVERVLVPGIVEEEPKEERPDVGGKEVRPSNQDGTENKKASPNRSSSSSGSSSDSSSSSSGSDSDSSSSSSHH